jgi:hypothetical protein
MRVVLAGLLLVSCSSKDPAPSASATAPAATSAVAAPAPSLSARPPVDDLDVAPLQKALKCAAGAKSGPCKILEAIGSCGAWEGVSPAGEAKYLGRSWDLKDGKPTEGYAVLRSRNVPLAEAMGGIPARIGIEKVPDDLPSMLGIKKAVQAFERHDVTQKGNAGLAWVKDKKDFSESPAFATTKKGVLVQSDDVAYVCKGSAQELFYARPKAASGGKGDGLYAELWPVTW